MARNRKGSTVTELVNETDEVQNVDAEDFDTPVDVDAPEDVAEETKEAKPAKDKKGALPEGYVTPIGLAHALSEKYDKEIKPQIVYSYIKNARKDHPFPTETVTDSAGKERFALLLEAGLTWWDEHLANVAERKANAAAKKATKKDKAETQADVEDTEPAVEQE